MLPSGGRNGLYAVSVGDGFGQTGGTVDGSFDVSVFKNQGILGQGDGGRACVGLQCLQRRHNRFLSAHTLGVMSTFFFYHFIIPQNCPQVKWFAGKI